jgi:hypothetical protein
MKKELTLGNLLGILVPIFVLILGWGISVNTRLSEQSTDITNNKKDIEKLDVARQKQDDKIDQNFKLIQDKLDKILYNEIQQKK